MKSRVTKLMANPEGLIAALFYFSQDTSTR